MFGTKATKSIKNIMSLDCSSNVNNVQNVILKMSEIIKHLNFIQIDGSHIFRRLLRARISYIIHIITRELIIYAPVHYAFVGGCFKIPI